MRFATYGRKSVYSDKSDSVDNQERMCREYADFRFKGQVEFFESYINKVTKEMLSMKMMNIGEWPGEIHTEYEQVKRIESGKKLVKDIVSDAIDGSIQIQGSAAEPYIATLNTCNCTDFQFRGKPCKHMYCLAWKLGLLKDAPVLKPKKDRCFNPVSEINRFRELYEMGEISADAYVKICTALSKVK